MTSKAESCASKILRMILKHYEDSDAIQESAEFREVLSAFEFYIPELLSNKYDFWKNESLDGVYCQKFIKIGHNEIELMGMCILITDQTLTPLHLQLQIDEKIDKFKCVNCRVGEKTPTGLLRIPYESSKWLGYMNFKMTDDIDWEFEIKR